jgi:hypothetical protein
LDTLFKVKNEQDARLIISIFGGISTILSNFIGVIYLRMYSETIKSLSTFHSRLVTTHHLHLANCLNSKIDDPKLKDKTCSQMAMEIIKSSHLEEFNKNISDASSLEKK